MVNLIKFLADSVTYGEVEIGGEIVNDIRVVYNGIKIGVPIIFKKIIKYLKEVVWCYC